MLLMTYLFAWWGQGAVNGSADGECGPAGVPEQLPGQEVAVHRQLVRREPVSWQVYHSMQVDEAVSGLQLSHLIANSTGTSRQAEQHTGKKMPAAGLAAIEQHAPHGQHVTAIFTHVVIHAFCVPGASAPPTFPEGALVFHHTLPASRCQAQAAAHAFKRLLQTCVIGTAIRLHPAG